MGAKRRSLRSRGPVSLSSELEPQSAAGIITRRSVRCNGRKQNASKKTPKKQQVTMPKRRSSRMKKSVQVTGSSHKGDLEENVDSSKPDETEVLPFTVVNNSSKTTYQSTSWKSTAGVYDFEFHSGNSDEKLKQELLPDKEMARSEKRKALARSALENLRNEVTRKCKRPATKSRKVKSSPKDHGAPAFQRTSTKRRRANTASASTPAQPKKCKIVVQNPVTNLCRLHDKDIKASGGKGSVRDSTDSGLFISPTSFSDSLKNTSTPGENTFSTPNIILRPSQDPNESLFEEVDILAGAPDLSPVKDSGNPDTEQVSCIPVPYVEVKKPRHQDQDEDEEHFSYRTLSISKTYSNCSFKGMVDKSPECQPKKAKKRKKKKGVRQSNSQYDAWAEKMNSEFEELDNYDLSVE